MNKCKNNFRQHDEKREDFYGFTVKKTKKKPFITFQ